MKTTHFFKVIYLAFCITTIIILSGMSQGSDEVSSPFENEGVGTPTSPISLQMYECIEKYSDQYDIPKYVAYNVAYKETTYRGPFDWRYNPSRISCVGALGPMQIMPGTARLIQKHSVPNETLKNNIRLNIEISMKLLRRLHDKYQDWAIVCGCYNTGRPLVNDYARFCVKNQNYQKNWLLPKTI